MRNEDDGACDMMQNALLMKCDPSNTDMYIKFLTTMVQPRPEPPFGTTTRLPNPFMNY
jgi:hypothetical protein